MLDNLNETFYYLYLCNEYDFFEEFTPFGNGMSVVHPKHGKENPIGFDERRFYKHFEIIKI